MSSTRRTTKKTIAKTPAGQKAARERPASPGNRKTLSVPTRSKSVPATPARQSSGSRVLQAPPRSWRQPRTWGGPPAPKRARLSKARHIFMQGMRSVRALGASAAWLFAVYAVLMLALVKGFSLGKDFAQTSATLNALFEGIGGKLQGAAVQISLLLSDASSSQLANGTVYQTILFIIFSLAIIWLFRQHQAGRPVTFRAALYRGMFPLVPFMLVLLIMGLQLVPLAAGAYLFSTVVSGGIAVGSLEQVLAFIGLVGLALWSLRMLLASVFALLIVTLPDMAPLEAIRTAKALVYKRRLLVARKLLFLPFAILVGSSLLIMPFLVFLPGLAVWVFFVLSSTWFVVVYAYLYTLYRELIR